MASLSAGDSVAVVGTREPTERGLEVASRVARYFAEHGYTIIGGLAKGIDTAAHAAALEAGGRTIAVLGTPLDKVYPAENKGLAQRIVSQSGALVSELAFGQRSYKGGFVRRDRIQSGLSLGVIAVQTRADGGTMHTVAFAGRQKRLVLCPQPLASEADAPQYEGIWQILRSGTGHGFQADDYPTVMRLLTEGEGAASSR